MFITNNVKKNCIVITSSVFFFDQLTKFIVKNNFIELKNKNFIIFNLDFIKNDGAAFNIFSNNTLFLSSISIISSVFIIFYLIYGKNICNSDRYGLAYILGGSLGNGIDRVMNGFVIDFINLNFVNFPVFNIADISINIGFLLILFNLIKNKN